MERGGPYLSHSLVVDSGCDEVGRVIGQYGANDARGVDTMVTEYSTHTMSARREGTVFSRKRVVYTGLPLRGKNR